MTKKNYLFILVVAVLAAVYVIYFTDWFRPKTVSIYYTSRHLHPRALRGGALPELVFGVNQSVQITEIKVVPVADLRTNLHPLPTWHLVSNSNSVPVKQFHYGQFIGGMRPTILGARPQSLTTNVIYRLFLTAGRITGQTDFELK